MTVTRCSHISIVRLPDGWTCTDPACSKEFPLGSAERKVWFLWNLVSDSDPSPVKRIAHDLEMSTADVAAIVYPAEQFGRWDDSQEPDLP